MPNRATALTAVLTVLLIAACSAAPAASPSPSPSVPPTTPPSAEPSVAPSVPPSAPPSQAPSEEPSSDPELNAAELALIEQVRSDARGDAPCSPIRGDELRAGATAGVECSRNDTSASTIRIFSFPDGRDATVAYFQILDEVNVAARTGGCADGTDGDQSWTPGDGDFEVEDQFTVEIDGEFYSVNRYACFLDDDGLAANVSLCGDGLMVEAISQDDDIAALWEAVDFLPEGFPRDTPSAPGVCYSEA
jgi:hypothetical protein